MKTHRLGGEESLQARLAPDLSPEHKNLGITYRHIRLGLAFWQFTRDIGRT